jgi:hypothetical protein
MLLPEEEGTMSDLPQGEGRWQASDGKWYPPESAPKAQPQVSAKRQPEAGWFSKWNRWVVIGVVAFIIVGVLGAIFGGDNESDEGAGGTDDAAAGSEPDAADPTPEPEPGEPSPEPVPSAPAQEPEEAEPSQEPEASGPGECLDPVLGTYAFSPAAGLSCDDVLDEGFALLVSEGLTASGRSEEFWKTDVAAVCSIAQSGSEGTFPPGLAHLPFLRDEIVGFLCPGDPTLIVLSG